MNKLYTVFAGNILLLSLFFQLADPAGKCGTTLHSISPQRGLTPNDRIVGGVDVGYYKYPWYVALMRKDEIYCGGTLISQKYIVSAAHCYEEYFEQASAGKIKLENVLTPVFGVYNICNTNEATQKKNKISKVFIHEKYDKKGNYFDISLLKLKKKAKGFEPCCMPSHVYTSDQRPKEGYITGLGDQIYHDKNLTCTLREARILIHPDDVCKKMLDDSGEKGSELNGAFCAGYLEGGVDACQGDSGGPLMIFGNHSKLILLGVVSFGDECAKPKRLGVYTDVSKYLDWIYGKMKQPLPTEEPTGATSQSTSPTSVTSVSTSSSMTTESTSSTITTESTSSSITTESTSSSITTESTSSSMTTESSTATSEQSTTEYHPSTYVFPTDLTTETTTQNPYQPQYGHNRPIIIIINKKNKQKTQRRARHCHQQH